MILLADFSPDDSSIFSYHDPLFQDDVRLNARMAANVQGAAWGRFQVCHLLSRWPGPPYTDTRALDHDGVRTLCRDVLKHMKLVLCAKYVLLGSHADGEPLKDTGNVSIVLAVENMISNFIREIQRRIRSCTDAENVRELKALLADLEVSERKLISTGGSMSKVVMGEARRFVDLQKLTLFDSLSRTSKTPREATSKAIRGWDALCADMNRWADPDVNSDEQRLPEQNAVGTYLERVVDYALGQTDHPPVPDSKSTVPGAILRSLPQLDAFGAL